MYPGHWGAVTPEKPAVIMAGTGETVTHGELDERSRRLARLLRAGGLEPGDHLAVFLPNHPRYFEVLWAAPFEYYKDPAQTRSTQHPVHPNWTALGDVGRIDEEGFLYLTDRATYMIVSGGVNIYPQEIEDCLIMHPRVEDAAVIGVPHDEMGEEVKAVVQLRPGVTADGDLERELLAYARQRLSHYKCPRSIDFEAQLPRLPTGKLYKRLLRDRYWAGHDTRIV